MRTISQDKKASMNEIIDFFMENPTATIMEISTATGVSKSSVQRYLNHPDVVGLMVEKTGRIIADQLKYNKGVGNSKGGRTTFVRYDAIKDENGKFIGLDENIDEEKEERKRETITEVVLVFSRCPYLTITEISNLLGYEDEGDYVYDCLTDPRVYEIFGPVMANSILERLEKNVFSIFRKLPSEFNIEMLDEVDLSDREKDILRRRLNNGGIPVSADKVAAELEISRAMVLKIENRAVNKISEHFGNVKKR